VNLREVDPGRPCWRGSVFAGRRELRVEPGPGGMVLVTHVQDVTGALFPWFVPAMGGAVQKPHDN